MPASLSPDVRDLLALTLVPGIGPRLTTALLERFGTIDRVMRATEDQLTGVPRVGAELAARIAAAAAAPDADAEAERVAKAGVQLLVLGTPEYPVALASVEDAPHLLYCRGDVRLGDANAVAIV